MALGHFWPKENNLNKLDRGLLVDATTKYQGSQPYGCRQEDFFHISLYKPTYVKHLNHGAGPFLAPGE